MGKKFVEQEDGGIDEAGHVDWLIKQLQHWPERVDQRFTTNQRYLMKEAARFLKMKKVK